MTLEARDGVEEPPITEHVHHDPLTFRPQSQDSGLDEHEVGEDRAEPERPAE